MKCYYIVAEGIEAIRNEKVRIMLNVLKNKVDLNNIHFSTHKLAIEDAKKLFEQDGWIATK